MLIPLHNVASFFLFFTLKLITLPASDVPLSSSQYFIFNGFHDSQLILDGYATIDSSGLLNLANSSTDKFGHAFFPTPFPFLNSLGEQSSFSTSFVFAIVPKYPDISSEGLAFAISPSSNLSSALPGQFLGLFNHTSNGQASNHIVAVEFDTNQNEEFNDLNDNHVGIDLNGLSSVIATRASYSPDSSSTQKLSLISGQPIRVWAEYDAKKMEFNVTVAPLDSPKPVLPLLSSVINLSSIFLNQMYVGFSASSGSPSGANYILGWSFCLNGRAEELVISKLPSLHQQTKPKNKRKKIYFWLPVVIAIPVLTALIALLSLLLKRQQAFTKASEDWEKDYGPQRFSYRDLRKATGGFSNENLLGNGGFGDVYKGVLSKSKQEVAVKRISHNSKQGMKEFVAEITSIGGLRHRNLVQLLGYSRRRGKLNLVYEFMPNGSLDKFLFPRAEQSLSWKQRLHIIKGIAAGLLYLHEEWEQVVLHRDIKPSNVLLDADFNGKLGDFGLAKLHDRGRMEVTTQVMGTLGYLAPELSRTGKSTTSSDVFAFGAFMLEVACGKKPVELKTTGIELVLVDWVLELMESGELIEARDRRLGDDFVAEEVEMVLRLGLMCSSPVAEARPTMRQVLQCLEGEMSGIRARMAEDSTVLHSAVMNNRMIGDANTSSFGGGAPAVQGSLFWRQNDKLQLSFGR